jgi:hypothetical protein
MGDGRGKMEATDRRTEIRDRRTDDSDQRPVEGRWKREALGYSRGRWKMEATTEGVKPGGE